MITKNKYTAYSGGMNDFDLAQYFIDHHKQDVRWLSDAEKWILFDGKCWMEDKRNEIKTLMQETLRAVSENSRVNAKEWYEQKKKSVTGTEEEVSTELAKLAGKYASAKRQAENLQMTERYRAVLDAVKNKEMTITKDVLDIHPNLFNVENGVIDLSDNGNFIPHAECRNFYMTKIAKSAYGVKAKCPEWLKFIKFLFPDKDMQNYIQRMCGYLLTGYVSEQVIFLLLGAGNNGKSMFAAVLQTILNDYSVTVPFDTLMAQSYDSQLTPHLSRLPGMRLAVISETKIGKAWDAGLLKSATGGDMMTTNPKHKDAYQFKATHKFMVLSNHKPRVNDNSLGFWRRMHIIPFERVIENPEPFEKVLQKFMNEASGILNWMIEGERMRQEHRLTVNIPKAITDAVNDYRSEEDVFSEILSLRFVLDPLGNARTDNVRIHINAELKKRSHHELSAKTITSKLQEKGVKRGGNANMLYIGLRELTISEIDALGLPIDIEERTQMELAEAQSGELFSVKKDKK